RVGVGQNPFVDGQLVASLVDTLEDGDRVAGGFADNLLKAERGAVEQLQRAGDSLVEVFCAPLRGFIRRPGHPANLGHGREAIVHFRHITAGLPRVAPRPVDAQAAFAGSEFAGYMALIVCAWGWNGGAHDWISFSGFSI